MSGVSVLTVIVNYRTADLAIEAVAALEPEATARGDTFVVIVDNGSGDDSVARLIEGVRARGFDSWCAVHDAGRNGGFAAGNNAGLAYYRRRFGDGGQDAPNPEFLWLLNPDTIPQPGAIAGLVDFLRARPDVGIAGGRCLHEDGTVWPSAFRFVSFRSELGVAVHLGLVGRLLGRVEVAPVGGPSDEPAPAEWISGTSMMIRREVLDRIGPMDEGYFLYFEETDYCARAAAAGFGIWTVPASRVKHLGGQSTGVTGASGAQKRRPRYWFASRARFMLHLYGAGYTHATNLVWLALYPVGSLITRLRGRRRTDPPAYWYDFLIANYGPGGIMYRPATRARLMGVDDGKAGNG